jgi:2-polyprenyl-3-methyl-5-hydroxy-6-metoxy-1,4-benzoquinol methylase
MTVPAGVELKAEAYYEESRPELRDRIPAGARIVLDVGCGRGALGAALKSDRPEARVYGLEYVAEAAEVAAERLDDVVVADLDALEALPAHWGASFDAVVCGDVLEHLRDPARILRLLRGALAPGGVIVASIPNVKHWSVVYPLLVQDRFTYQDAGLLDRTHVHFFTLGEIDTMFSDCALAVQSVTSVVLEMPPEIETLLTAAVALGAERAETAARLNAYQYLVVASAA